jgi:Major Facilitator Superfamily
MWGATTGVGIALGPIVGGWPLERFWWGSVFLFMAPVAAGIAILVATVVPPSRDPRTPPVDWAGLAMSALGMGALIFTIIEAPVVGWLSGRTVAGFAASGAVTVAFFALSGFIFLVTQYFQFLKAYSPFVTGVRLLPVAASVAISSLVGTRLAVKVGNKLVVTTGLSAPATEAIMGVVSKEQAGVGSAVNDTTRLLGGTLGVAVIGSVAASLYAGRLGSTLEATQRVKGKRCWTCCRPPGSASPFRQKAPRDGGASPRLHGMRASRYRLRTPDRYRGYVQPGRRSEAIRYGVPRSWPRPERSARPDARILRVRRDAD